MSLLRKLYFYFIFLALEYQLQTVAGSESYQNCEYDLKKSFPFRGESKIELKIETHFKQEIINLKNHLSEYMKNEFTQQKEELVLLLETIKSQTTELTNQIEKKLSDHKNHLESFIRVELEAQRIKSKEDFHNEISNVCGKRIAENNQKLTSDIANEFSNQEKVQKKLIKDAFRSIVPTRVDSDHWDKNFNCTLNCGPLMDLPNSCEEAMFTRYHQSGVYLINGTNSVLKPFYGYCKRIDDKVWTIIQRREDGSVDFYKNWIDYKLGFGNLYGEFWLGLERLHAMTTKHKHELLIWLESHNGKTAYAHYMQIVIDSETEKYKLTVEDYSGNAGNAFTEKFNGKKFSTADSCNDGFCDNPSCSVGYKGAWWFSDCYLGHLNGPYIAPVSGVDWNPFETRLKYSQMAIRRV